MTQIFTILLLLSSTLAWSSTENVHSMYSNLCEKATSIIPVDTANTLIRDNKISNPLPTQPDFMNQFLNELMKFPESLRKELASAGATMHAIQGNGVTDDNSWTNGVKTFDGRDWSKVPGAGGFPYLNSTGKFPTRIVVNHLYDNHGSVNLVLHENGHTLDSIYSHNTISDSSEFMKVFSSNAVKEFLLKVCGKYCTENRNEGFAELFAHYYACEMARTEMEIIVPEAANYLRRLKRIR